MRFSRDTQLTRNVGESTYPHSTTHLAHFGNPVTLQKSKLPGKSALPFQLNSGVYLENIQTLVPWGTEIDNLVRYGSPLVTRTDRVSITLCHEPTGFEDLKRQAAEWEAKHGVGAREDYEDGAVVI